ncbi:MAG: porin [Tepidimonas sp.]|uniref:porin n=1 Tax=Tepidimonas sp. TaxID=2002775 RepID=UPI00298F01F7|nr:porin [Tepidimonas sp.]MDW8335851.1 porin [Tepidimonas sp.]
MKKSLLAMAALLAAGSALAQSSVTIYGRVDLSVGSIKDDGTGAGANKGKNINQMFHGGQGGLTTSRWGLRGTEDLGGGLKAAFQLENRFNPDTGASQDPFFRGEASLSLIGGFGQLKLGRSTTVYDDMRALGQSRDVFDSAFTASSNGVFARGGDYSSRWDNKISYYSPDLGGFYVGVDHALNEKTGTDVRDGYALKVGYATKVLNVGLGYQDEKRRTTNNNITTITRSDKYTVLAARYDFGAFALSGMVNWRDGGQPANGDDEEYSIGVQVPMDAWTFSAGLASAKTKKATTAGNNGKASGFALGVTYSLSKRTRLYAGYRDVEVKNNVGIKTKDERLYAIGVRHDF